MTAHIVGTVGDGQEGGTKGLGGWQEFFCQNGDALGSPRRLENRQSLGIFVTIHMECVLGSSLFFD